MLRPLLFVILANQYYISDGAVIWHPRLVPKGCSRRRSQPAREDSYCRGGIILRAGGAGTRAVGDGRRWRPKLSSPVLRGPSDRHRSLDQCLPKMKPTNHGSAPVKYRTLVLPSNGRTSLVNEIVIQWNVQDLAFGKHAGGPRSLEGAPISWPGQWAAEGVHRQLILTRTLDVNVGPNPIGAAAPFSQVKFRKLFEHILPVAKFRRYGKHGRYRSRQNQVPCQVRNSNAAMFLFLDQPVGQAASCTIMYPPTTSLMIHSQRKIGRDSTLGFWPCRFFLWSLSRGWADSSIRRADFVN